MIETMRKIWSTWKRVGKKIGDTQARILLTLFYFILLTPFALAVQWQSDPLSIRKGSHRGWQLRGKEEAPMERATRQY
jgi:hypothetical protein